MTITNTHSTTIPNATRQDFNSAVRQRPNPMRFAGFITSGFPTFLANEIHNFYLDFI